MSGLKSLFGLALSAAMIIYAVPRLEMGQGWTLPTIFAIAWIGIALLILASHLHELLGVDEEQRRELRRIRRLRKWKTEQWILRKSRMKQSR